MNKLKSKNGITLVALVITIVVLLILAGVSINLVLGDNGIVKKAKDAKILTEIAKVQDAVNFKISENDIDKAIDNGANNIYRVDGFVQEKKFVDGAETDDIYVVRDLSKIGTSSSIGNGSFSDSDNIKKITDLRDILIIDQDNQVHYVDKNGKLYGNTEINGFKKVTGSSDEWEVEENAVVKYLGTSNDIVIPNYVGNTKITKIGNEIFKNSPKTGSLVISDGIEVIGYSAFYDSSFSGNLEIPDSITIIEDGAFCGCAGLTGNLVIPELVKSIGSGSFTRTSFDGALTIGENVTSIGESAFRGCGFTGNLVIPNSVTTIGQYAFYGCAEFTGRFSYSKLCYDNRRICILWLYWFYRPA